MLRNFEKISIVILNYNNLSDTVECLNSVFEIDYPNFEVIVIDNNSKVCPKNILLEKFKNITYIQNDQNLGFSGGCNTGIKKALKNNSSYVFLLNNDTTVDKNILKEFAKEASKKPDGGIFGGTILKYDNRDTIDHLKEMWSFEKLNFVSQYVNKPFNSSKFFPEQTDSICGCMFFVKKEVFEKVGLLDENYFLLWEESDFCVNARKKGYEIWTVPKAKLWHKISQSFTGGTVHSDYYHWRNKLYFINKNLTKKEKIKAYKNTLVFEIFKILRHYLIKNLTFQVEKIFFKKKLNSKKIMKILRYKSSLNGILDYFFKRLKKGPMWISDPLNHKYFNCINKKP